MASFLEIKEIIKKILFIRDNIDETSDIIIPKPQYFDEGTDIILDNGTLKNAYDKMLLFSKKNLEMYSSCYREAAFQYLSIVRHDNFGNASVEDDENDISYTIGPASIEYCMYLLNIIVDYIKTHDRVSLFSVRMRCNYSQQRSLFKKEHIEKSELLPKLLNIITLKIECKNDKSIHILRKYARSFEFLFMYKKSVPISEYTSIEEMFRLETHRKVIKKSSIEIDVAPRRNFNPEVIDYYKMALESKDPFTSYISYYHVIEYYFDAVFRKKLTENIRDKMTHPDFSYKSETKLYDLAKYIKKQMKSDDESGKGNELESLKYVLIEYVKISELKNRIEFFESEAVKYYQKNAVPFTAQDRNKIAWNNAEGVITNIANRIYDTRNALVHSKSEQANSQYRPYENKFDLEKELPLIRAVAEIVIINSSKEI